ncbi:MAG: ATP synthase subunit I [Candidatus Korobacteraceae bacterium]
MRYSDLVSVPTPEPTSAFAEAFLDRALPRIRKFLLVLAGLGTVVCVAFFRWPVTAGFAAGAVVSYVNQLWLERAIDALGQRITSQQSHERGGRIVLRALLRYVLIAGGAYVIFNVSLAGLYGFLGGICLPIAAIACEVAVEVFVVLRRGI